MAPPRRTEQTLSSAISRCPSPQAQGELAADICSTDPRRLSGTQASDPFLPGPGSLKSIIPHGTSQPASPASCPFVAQEPGKAWRVKPGSLEKSEPAGPYSLRIRGGSQRARPGVGSVFAGARDLFLASSARARPSPISPPRLLLDPSGSGRPCPGPAGDSPGPPAQLGPRRRGLWSRGGSAEGRGGGGVSGGGGGWVL